MQDQTSAAAGGFRLPGSPLEIAWAAGLFEGEGCISAKHQGKRGSGIQLRLGMTDKDAVERFKRIVGCGGFYAHKPGTGSHKPMWTWYAYDAQLTSAILRAFLPFFCARRTAKALEAIAIAEKIVACGNRTHCPKGHPYAGENLMIEKITRPSGVYEARRCRKCRLEQMRNRVRKRLGTQPENFRV